MAGTVGGVACTFVKGHCPRPKQRLEIWRVPGLNGIGAAAMGANDGQFSIRAVLFNTIQYVEIWRQAVESLQGQIVTIVNDWNVSFPNCLITNISPMQTTAIVATNGSTCRAEFVIDGVVTG
jgi:hypothetical protein